MKTRSLMLALLALLAAACESTPPVAAPVGGEFACPVEANTPPGQCPAGCVWTGSYCKQQRGIAVPQKPVGK